MTDETIEGSATLDDLSALLWAQAELHQAAGESDYLECAVETAKVILSRFGKEGALNLVVYDMHDLLPACDAGDDFLPSGNGMAANCFITLSRLCGDHAWLSRAKEIVDSFGGALNEYPTTCAGLTLAALRLTEKRS